jgi:hypothetical protein
MNIEKALYIIGASAAAYFILTSLYNSQFKDEDFEYDPDWLGDLTGLREDK